MKIFRYKTVINDVTRIISVGIQTDTFMNITDYSFSHVILNPIDKYDSRMEIGKLVKRMADSDYAEYDVEIPSMYDSYGTLKSFAFNYCVRIMNDWCKRREISGKIHISDHKIDGAARTIAL